jgi:hypothetical protein
VSRGRAMGMHGRRGGSRGSHMRKAMRTAGQGAHSMDAPLLASRCRCRGEACMQVSVSTARGAQLARKWEKASKRRGARRQPGRIQQPAGPGRSSWCRTPGFAVISLLAAFQASLVLSCYDPHCLASGFAL